LRRLDVLGRHPPRKRVARLSRGNVAVHAAELAPEMVCATPSVRPDDGAQLLVDEPKETDARR